MQDAPLWCLQQPLIECMRTQVHCVYIAMS
jgi:hypothetical protein